jgi:hypothetical protein
VLTDEEADTIRRKLAEGWRGPVLLTWLEQLLQDREESTIGHSEWELPRPRISRLADVAEAGRWNPALGCGSPFTASAWGTGSSAAGSGKSLGTAPPASRQGRYIP